MQNFAILYLSQPTVCSAVLCETLFCNCPFIFSAFINFFSTFIQTEEK